MDETFAGYPVTLLGCDAWRAGAPNSKIDTRGARVNVDSLSLTAGDCYEVEAAVASRAAAARTLAVAQDQIRAAVQLTPPVDPPTLYERRPARVICLATAGLKTLVLREAEAAADFGISYATGADGLAGSATRRREAVRALRGHGWRGPIVLPGLDDRAQVLLIPSEGLRGGAIQVTREATLVRPLPRSVTDFILGRRGDLPESSDITGDALSRPRIRAVTISWRPSEPVGSLKD